MEATHCKECPPAELVFTAFVKSWAAQCCLPESTLRRKHAEVRCTWGYQNGAHVSARRTVARCTIIGAGAACEAGGNDLYDAEEQKAAAALQAKREARVKAARRADEAPLPPVVTLLPP